MEDKDYTLTESFELPSKGQMYDTPFDPHLSIRSMTTAEEMRRLSHNDLEYKKMCDIIDDCLVGPNKPRMSSYDMCIGDYQFLLHRLRVATYGTKYKMIISCPVCHKITETEINLDELMIHEYTDSIKEDQFITLPVSKKRIELRVQTPRMLDEIETKKREMQRKTKDRTSRYDYLYTLESLIKTIDGQVFNEVQLETFITGMPMRDVNYLLQKADRLNQKVGIDTNVVATCNDCGNELVTTFRITGEFFGPTIDE